MAGIALLVDLYRKNPKILHSHDLLSASFTVSAVTAAAATLSSGHTLASRFLFGDAGRSFAHADAGEEFSEDYLSKLQTVYDSLKYSTKVYPIELKPLYSAFRPKALAVTTLRSLSLFYLPLLEPRSLRDDDEDFPQDPVEPDLVTPLKKSVKQICRESAVVTTRRVLERLAVHYCSQQLAWKLIKDVPKSAKRKALRGLSSYDYFCSVSRTSFRGNLLVTAASWIVLVGIDIYRCFSGLFIGEEAEGIDKVERFKIFGKRVFGLTMKCSGALTCASVGAAIGSSLIHPSFGAIIGAGVGDVAGPILVIYLFEKGFDMDLRAPR